MVVKRSINGLIPVELRTGGTRSAKKDQRKSNKGSGGLRTEAKEGNCHCPSGLVSKVLEGRENLALG